MPDPVRNVADEGQVRDSGRRARLARERHLTDLKTVIETREGRRYVWSLVLDSGLFKDIWRQSAEIHFLAGKQQMGLHILDDLRALDPTIFATMYLEAHEEEEKNV